MVSLRPQQIEQLTYYIAQKKCMDLSDPATGKTPPVCVNQLRRWQEGMATVWVQPKQLMPKNKRELVRFTGLDPDQICILDGSPKQIEKMLARTDVAIWLMGPERFRRSWTQLPENARRALDVDEFHLCFAGSDSKRTQEFYKFMARAEECVFMTGTLIHGRIDTVFPAIHAIEPRYYAGYESFLRHHAYLDEYGKPFAWKNHERIALILAKHAIRYTFEATYGAESKVVLGETAFMAPKQRKIYDEFLRTLTVDLGESFIDGSESAQKLLVGRKIMEVPFSLVDPRGKEFPRVDLLEGANTGKEDLLEVHFADHARTGMPIVVFSMFQRQQDRIAEHARNHGMTAAVMNGNTSPKRKDEIDQAFVRGEIQVLSVSPQVASAGFNWQYWGEKEVDHFVFASLDYMDTNFLQAYRRGMRGARKTPLRITVLQYENSMDSDVFDIIERKSKDANKIDTSRKIYSFNKLDPDLPLVA